jgi:hypothetical protein
VLIAFLPDYGDSERLRAITAIFLCFPFYSPIIRVYNLSPPKHPLGEKKQQRCLIEQGQILRGASCRLER